MDSSGIVKNKVTKWLIFIAPNQNWLSRLMEGRMAVPKGEKDKARREKRFRGRPACLPK